MTGFGEIVRLDARGAAAARLLALAAVLAVTSAGRPVSPPAVPGASGSEASRPLSFVANRGQTDARVHWYAQAPGITTFLTQDKVVMSLGGTHAVELRFVGADPHPRMAAADRRPSVVNYFGADERHTSIPTYGSVVYRDLWPGIDLAFIGQPERLKYEFRVAAGADPSDIRLAYAGVESLSVAADGGLAARTRAGMLRDAAPRSYQGSTAVASRFDLRGPRTYGFEVGGYDRGRPLVIDPGLEYSTLIGGDLHDEPVDIAVDTQGSAYVVGQSSSPDFPTSPGAFDSSPFGPVAFVTKLTPDGSDLVWSTVLEGSESDRANGIAVDAAGNSYVVGTTGSGDFPTTPGAFDRNHAPGFFSDVFVTKLNSTGSALIYSTFLGGTSHEDFDSGSDIAVDGQGFAYLIGSTDSPDFPTTPGAWDRTHEGPADAFITKLNQTGSGLAYSTLLGGSDSVVDVGFAIAVDQFGAAYATGRTHSADFPTTPGALRPNITGDSDGYLTKLAPTGAALEYSTFLGGSGEELGPDDDRVDGVAVDGAGHAFVTGRTVSADFPTTPSAFDPTYNGGSDAFAAKLNATGSGLEYSTFLGGAGEEWAFGIEPDGHGRVFVTGRTTSGDYPTTPQAFDPSYNGNNDAYVTRLSTGGDALSYSTYLGGATRIDEGLGIALDSAGDAYVTGRTQSSDFPATPGAFDTSFDNTFLFRYDGFVAKLSAGPGPPVALSLTPETATNTVGEGGHCVTATLADAAGEPTPGVEVSFTVTGATSASGTQTSNGSGEATFCYQGPEFPGTDQISATVEPDGPSDTATKTWVTPESSADCKVNAEGRIRAANGDRADFHLEAKTRNAGSLKGRARYTDRGPADQLQLNAKSVDALVCEGRDATIFGHDGDLAFLIEVSDRARNGRQDRFRIVTVQGYDSGEQPPQRGHVKVR